MSDRAPPWLSMVTVTRDDPLGLARTLASAESLRAAGAEHIVVDGSVNCACEEGTTTGASQGVRFFRRRPLGVADAFNVGLQEAGGSWIWFLNGGDAAHESLDIGWLKMLLDSSGSDVVIGGLVYDEDGDLRLPPPLCEQWPLYRSWIPHPSTIVRREQFAVHGSFDPKFSIAMDYEWWVRTLTAGARVDTIALPLARFAPGGLSQRVDLKHRLQHEYHSALLRHQRGLWRSLFLQNARLARASFRALLGVLFSRGRD